MPSHLYRDHFDLVTPDGVVTSFELVNPSFALATVYIEGISPAFVGFRIDVKDIIFNCKSVLAQVGLTVDLLDLELKKSEALAHVRIRAFGPLAQKMLCLLGKKSRIGKLFAADARRRVRNPDYLYRMFGRSDSLRRPLLSLGSMHGSRDLVLEKVDGRTVAYLNLIEGQVRYESTVEGFLPTISKALEAGVSVRSLLSLHQIQDDAAVPYVCETDILLVKTLPLHIRTVFATVVDDLLPSGYKHTSASVLSPDTDASGDIYELYGTSSEQIRDIPLEFYTLEPHREHVFFADRDQLIDALADNESLFTAFRTAPGTLSQPAAVFVVKGEQLFALDKSDWSIAETQNYEHSLLDRATAERKAILIQRAIEADPAYPFLEAIESGLITSQGILLTRFFPNPLMKRMLLSSGVVDKLKRLYFLFPSKGKELSNDDKNCIADLETFGIAVYWLDEAAQKIRACAELQ